MERRRCRVDHIMKHTHSSGWKQLLPWHAAVQLRAGHLVHHPGGTCASVPRRTFGRLFQRQAGAGCRGVSFAWAFHSPRTSHCSTKARSEKRGSTGKKCKP